MKKKNLAIKVVLVSMFTFVAVVAVQLYQDIKISDEKRELAIQSWAKENADSEQVLSSYRDCVGHGHAIEKYSKDKASVPITFAGCASQAGSKSLAAAIEDSTRNMSAPIPLRWL